MNILQRQRTPFRCQTPQNLDRNNSQGLKRKLNKTTLFKTNRVLGQ